MSPETRQKALAKLAKFTPKIGYPAVWRDYSALQISARRSGRQRAACQRLFDYQRNLNKLGKPIDRGEWFMTPQTVNAYYNPEMNEIVFPAAILQPPFFNAKADDAVNYGGIGAVIGHEISHGFDDQGSQYDGDGNLLGTPGWFTPADCEKFKAKTARAGRAVRRARAGARLPRQRRADAGREHRRQLRAWPSPTRPTSSRSAAEPAPVIDGLTGDQRFFMGWAQVWRAKTRESETILEIKTDPHSPEMYPRQHAADEPAAVLRRLRRQAGRRHVPAAGEARQSLVGAAARVLSASSAVTATST